MQENKCDATSVHHLQGISPSASVALSHEKVHLDPEEWNRRYKTSLQKYSNIRLSVRNEFALAALSMHSMIARAFDILEQHFKHTYFNP
ncbi:hypothetical protein CEXT_753881 [Caerostris extrusa]|uniref:Uncharacterized protein n=1 Tax=Caerostris extrusa TaxID=172846 RepID=A0AAV4VJ84_CAEEX|nr:hypothetical protein CEXT_753881 [Caerostris extrusa]